MPSTTTYSKPPIQEALIDIKVDYSESFDINRVEQIQNEFKEDLPQKTARNAIVFSINQDGPDVNNTQVDGFMFQAGDGSRVLQATKEGFTFSFINMYTNWDNFLLETFKYWDIFKTKMKPAKVKRVGVRYINKIDLPVDVEDLSEYFTTKVTLGNIDKKPLEIFMRAVVPYDSGTCILTEAINPSLLVGNVQGYILDIDAFSENQFEVGDNSKLIEILTQLKDIKNDVFEKSITDKTREIFS